MVNGPDSVYVERHGKIERAPVSFVDETHLRRIIDKIVGQVGRRIDEATPMVDARLPDGSRVNAVIHPLAIGGPFLTIRKFAADPFQVEDLISFGTLNAAVGPLPRGLRASAGSTSSCPAVPAPVRRRCSTCCRRSSPTTSASSPIEDAKELQLQQDHVLALEARPPNIEGRGEVTIRDLVRNCAAYAARPHRRRRVSAAARPSTCSRP